VILLISAVGWSARIRQTARIRQKIDMMMFSLQKQMICTILHCTVEAERKQLSSAGDLFLSKSVQVDSHSKKGDTMEPRLLVSESSLHADSAWGLAL